MVDGETTKSSFAHGILVSRTPAAKLVLIGLCVAVLMIGMFFVRDLVEERQERQAGVVAELSSMWGGHQIVAAPILAIPLDPEKATSSLPKYAYFLPKSVDIISELTPEVRSRGIFDALLYQAKTSISGTFSPIDHSVLDLPTGALQFKKARLVIGISDPNGLSGDATLKWRGKTSDLVLLDDDNLSADLPFKSEIGAPVDLETNVNGSGDMEFNVVLDVKGTHSLEFRANAGSAKVKLSGSWGHPSFIGKALPDSRTITESHFSAAWNIGINRVTSPKAWTGTNVYLNQARVGTTLHFPVSEYLKIDRAMKYALMITVMTFAVFFIIELRFSQDLHFMHYLLIGAAILVFYCLLLSLAEIISFGFAYAVSTIITAAMIGGYAKGVTRNLTIAFVCGGAMGFLYSYIYALVQLEEHALLSGSFGLVILLGVTMYATRQIDWHALGTIQNNRAEHQEQ
jgi:inner membrane protein